MKAISIRRCAILFILRSSEARWGQPRPMSADQRNLVTTLVHPPVPKAAQILWYQSKALELMAHFLFEPKDPELFCMRQKSRSRSRRANERVACARSRRPADARGARSGSRLQPVLFESDFSREVGLTIPQYLRNLRMERAAELLRFGPLQCHRSGYGSGLFEPQSFQQSLLRNNWLLPRALSCREAHCP